MDRLRRIPLPALVAVLLVIGAAVGAGVVVLTRGGDDADPPAVVTSTPGGGEVAVRPDGSTFTDEERGYSFVVPPGWQVLDPAPPAAVRAGRGIAGAVAAREGKEGSGKGFVVAQVDTSGAQPPEPELDRALITKTVRALLPAGAKTGEPTDLEVDGRPALAYELQLPRRGARPLRTRLVYLRGRDGALLQLACQAPDRQFRDFMSRCGPVIDSFAVPT